jgi:hypothetical protein
MSRKQQRTSLSLRNQVQYMESPWRANHPDPADPADPVGARAPPPGRDNRSRNPCSAASATLRRPKTFDRWSVAVGSAAKESVNDTDGAVPGAGDASEAEARLQLRSRAAMHFSTGGRLVNGALCCCRYQLVLELLSISACSRFNNLYLFDKKNVVFLI